MAHERANRQDKAGHSRRRRGDLSADDWRVWRQVAHTVQPLSGAFAAALKGGSTEIKAAAEADNVPPKVDKAAKNCAGKKPARAAAALRESARQQGAEQLPGGNAPAGSAPAGSVAGRGGGFDSSSYRKLARGRLPLEGRLDLHNYTQTEAHDALLYFVRSAQSRGKRHVLVITGKGLSSGSVGVLRGRVPHWLAQPLFRPYVSAVEPASRAHGGEGAFYVRLRRLL